MASFRFKQTDKSEAIPAPFSSFSDNVDPQTTTKRPSGSISNRNGFQFDDDFKFEDPAPSTATTTSTNAVSSWNWKSTETTSWNAAGSTSDEPATVTAAKVSPIQFKFEWKTPPDSDDDDALKNEEKTDDGADTVKWGGFKWTESDDIASVPMSMGTATATTIDQTHSTVDGQVTSRRRTRREMKTPPPPNTDDDTESTSDDEQQCDSMPHQMAHHKVQSIDDGAKSLLHQLALGSIRESGDFEDDSSSVQSEHDDDTKDAAECDSTKNEVQNIQSEVAPQSMAQPVPAPDTSSSESTELTEDVETAVPAQSKLSGYAFWRSVGSPKFICAPMVHQSEVFDSTPYPL